MMTISIAKNIVASFVDEACYMLKIDKCRLSVHYISNCQYGVIVNPNMDGIIVGEDFLKSNIVQKAFTPVRFLIYGCIGAIYHRWKHGLCEDAPSTIYAYGSALLLLKGFQCPQVPFPSNNKQDKSLEILKDEFGLGGNLFKCPQQGNDSLDFYQVHLDTSTSNRILSSFTQRNDIAKPKVIKSGEKGSKENPFDNIEQAAKWLKDTENEAFQNDGLMQDIANQQYFYDLNCGHFRIAWASPYVAHLKNDYPPKSFVISQMASMQGQMPFFCFKPNMYKHKFLYRGQSNHYEGIPCVPNLFRDKSHNDKRYYLDFMIFSQEMELLIKSLPLVQFMESGFELLHDIFKIRINYPGIAQHYYNKSYFLDLTSDLDVAKFFAVTTYDREHDVYSPILNSDYIGVLYYYNIEYPNAFQQHEGYALKNIGKQPFMRSGAQSGFLLEMDYGVDFKKLPEVNAVYFKHDAQLANAIFEKSNKGKDFFGEDILQHAWHDRFKQRFRDKVVSKETIKLNVKRNSGETEDSITQKLAECGISVDDYTPCFTPDELYSLYDHIEEWWSAFCNDIYFASSDGEWYRDEMKELSHRPEYREYFRCTS